MKNLFNKRKLLWFVQVLVYTGLTLFFVVPVSCSVSEQGIQIVSGDFDSPVLEDVQVVDSRHTRLIFSERIKISGAVVTEFVEGQSDSDEHSEDENLSVALKKSVLPENPLKTKISISEDGKTALFELEEETKIGKKYCIFGIVVDSNGNSLTFNVSFTGFNPRIPKILMTEIQNQCPNQKASEKSADIFRTEFVEFLCLEDGNLCGLELYSASKGNKVSYEFPSVEVCKGDVIVVHPRKKGKGCLNETGENLLAAYSGYASSCRDLWAENSEPPFGKSEDIIIIREKASQKIYDAFAYADYDASKKTYENSAQELFQSDLAQQILAEGIYKNFEPAQVGNMNDKTAVKTFYLKNAAEIQAKLLAGEDIQNYTNTSEKYWSVYDKKTQDTAGKL